MNPLSNSFRIFYPATAIKLVVLTIVIALGLTVYSEWSGFVSTTIEWQKSLHAMLADHIRAVSEDALKYGGALIALSFGYGVFHAVGPGHGKAVIVTYLGTNNESVKKGILISFAAALLQSIIAIVLVSVLAKVLKFKLADVHNYGNDIALVSYVLVVLLGVMLVFSALRRMVKVRRSNVQSDEPNTNKHNHKHHSNSHGDGQHDDTHSHSHSHDHAHASDCGCSHTHVPEQGESVWQTLTVIASMGLRPCSGAIVVLIYAHLVGVYPYGVIATLMMGVGTGLSVSLIAVLTLYARSWIERFIVTNEESHGRTHSFLSDYFNHYVRLAGGFVLVALGWSFLTVASALNAGHPLF